MPILERMKRTVQSTKAKLRETAAHHDLRHQPTGLGFALFDSIRMVRPDHWDALVSGHSVCMSRAFLETLEDHAPANIRGHFALIYQGQQPIAALSAQSVAIRASSLGSGEKSTEGIKQKLRKVADTPLEPIQTRVLVCGNLLSWGAHGVAIAPGADRELVWSGVAEAMYRLRRADKLFGTASVLMIKDLPADDTCAQKALRRFSYHPLETEPNMMMALRPQWTSFNAYLADMKSDYRSGIKKQIKDIEKGDLELIHWDAASVATHAKEIYDLYLQVHERQAFRLITITPEWIPALAARMGDGFRTKVVRTRSEGKLLGFITTMKDGDGAMGYYIGYDKKASASHPLYLRMLYGAVEDALEMKAQWLSLGRTALAPKAKLGAKPEPTVCYVRHRIQAMNLLVQGLLQILPEPSDAPERNPFKG